MLTNSTFRAFWSGSFSSQSTGAPKGSTKTLFVPTMVNNKQLEQEKSKVSCYHKFLHCCLHFQKKPLEYAQEAQVRSRKKESIWWCCNKGRMTTIVEQCVFFWKKTRSDWLHGQKCTVVSARHDFLNSNLQVYSKSVCGTFLGCVLCHVVISKMLVYDWLISNGITYSKFTFPIRFIHHYQAV